MGVEGIHIVFQSEGTVWARICCAGVLEWMGHHDQNKG